MPPGGGASRTWLRAAFALDSKASSSNGMLSTGLPPAFLCPSVRIAGIAASRKAAQSRPQATQALARRPWNACSGTQKRCFTNASASAVAPQEDEPVPEEADQTASPIFTPDEIASREDPDTTPPAPKKHRSLPLQCPGCGAFSQTASPDQPGYFDVTRHSTMEYLGVREPKKRYPDRVRHEDMIVQEAMRRLELEKGSESAELQELGVFIRPDPSVDEGTPASDEMPKTEEKEPEIICVRCHELVHHHAGKPIFHPGIDAIRETIAESPYKYNHVYHVLDAADFPMSLLPRIHELLDAMPLRSRNRRARHGKFFGGRKTELSFVITRADLLAPRKEQVDRLMPWVRETLRQALGRSGRDVRLGNIRCVSARRNWWTAELREEIYKNGGANWLVGKANVGKSYLVHHVFPKGRMDAERDRKTKNAIVVKNAPSTLAMAKSASGRYGLDALQEALGHDGDSDLYDAKSDAQRASLLADDGLLPPKPVETNYPQMPVVSNLPGTTASPIRIPFGGGKGELIDLPGLERTALIDHLQAEHQNALVMKMRVQPEQVVLTGTWHSLLIGGFIRITPRTPDLVFMTYNFTPLQEHRTGTDRAIEIQKQTGEINVENIAVPGTGEKIKLAGSFRLKYDVTKQRAGPITRKDAINISVDQLPYRVLSIDLLIEGCGWIEIVAQVRTRHLYDEEARRDYEAEKARREHDARVNKVGHNGVLQSLDLSDPAEDNGTDDDDDASADPFTAIFDAKNAPKKAPKKAPAPAPTPVKSSNAIQPPFQNKPEPEKLREPEPNWPVIDVFSPGGKFIGSRQPLGAWVMLQKKVTAEKKAMKSRPRKSMKGTKKQAKAAQSVRRENQARGSNV